jgi:hypothetical protein
MFSNQYFLFHYTIISDAKAAVDIHNKGGKGNIPSFQITNN